MLSKTPTKGNLNDGKTLTRNRTKGDLTDKSATKSGMIKSNTRGNLMMKKSTGNLHSTADKNDRHADRGDRNDRHANTERLNKSSSRKPATNSSSNSNKEFTRTNNHNTTREKGHKKRADNISQTIGVDELLSKDDPLIMPEPELPESIITSKAEHKLDFSDILDDRWSAFSKYLNKIDHSKILMVNKIFGKLSMSSLIGDVHKEIVENENKMKALQEVTY